MKLIIILLLLFFLSENKNDERISYSCDFLIKIVVFFY